MVDAYGNDSRACTLVEGVQWTSGRPAEVPALQRFPASNAIAEPTDCAINHDIEGSQELSASARPTELREREVLTSLRTAEVPAAGGAEERV